MVSNQKYRCGQMRIWFSGRSTTIGTHLAVRAQGSVVRWVEQPKFAQINQLVKLTMAKKVVSVRQTLFHFSHKRRLILHALFLWWRFLAWKDIDLGMQHTSNLLCKEKTACYLFGNEPISGWVVAASQTLSPLGGNKINRSYLRLAQISFPSWPSHIFLWEVKSWPWRRSHLFRIKTHSPSFQLHFKRHAASSSLGQARTHHLFYPWEVLNTSTSSNIAFSSKTGIPIPGHGWTKLIGPQTKRESVYVWVRERERSNRKKNYRYARRQV